MAHGYDTMMTPAIEDLIEKTESKFVLTALAAKRSREITNYLGQLGVGIGAIVPPQVISTSSKPLSIALEEIAEGKIEAIESADDDADDADDSEQGGEQGGVGALVSELGRQGSRFSDRSGRPARDAGA